jgi:hypothetical protein
MLCCAYASSRSFNNMRMGCSDWGVGNGSRKATVAERIGSGEQERVVSGEDSSLGDIEEGGFFRWKLV